jgi:limonene-1,2-epoxide hydrolase
MPNSPEDVVRSFCAARGSGDPDQLLAFVAKDAVFHNVPMETLMGEDALRAAFERYFNQASNFHFDILNMASSGGLVFAERLDHFDIGAAHVDLPCKRCLRGRRWQDRVLAGLLRRRDDQQTGIR